MVELRSFFNFFSHFEQEIKILSKLKSFQCTKYLPSLPILRGGYKGDTLSICDLTAEGVRFVAPETFCRDCYGDIMKDGSGGGHCQARGESFQ